MDEDQELPIGDDEFLNELDQGYVGLENPKVTFVEYTQEDYLPIDSGMVPGEENG